MLLVLGLLLGWLGAHPKQGGMANLTYLPLTASVLTSGHGLVYFHCLFIFPLCDSMDSALLSHKGAPGGGGGGWGVGGKVML